MNSWPHKHILTLANFSKEDYLLVLELAKKFNSLNQTGTKKIPALQGCLATSIFFETSTRTRNSFELAAKRLSADVQSFSPSTSAMAKGETHIDTALTYASMGSDILIIRHSSSHVPLEIAKKLDIKNPSTSIINAGDGLHSHPSQGLLDLYTLTKFFSPKILNPKILDSKTILILGDVLHSRVARSNIWALTAFGANIILCGPETLVPSEFKNFLLNTNSDRFKDQIENRGKIIISRQLNDSIRDADAVIVLRLQKERMMDNLLGSISSYSNQYCLTPETLSLNNKNIPVLHPGPINRGIEISSRIVDEYANCLINDQIKNGISVRMALLYLVSKFNKETRAI